MTKASLVCSQHIVNRSGVPEQACHTAAMAHFERLLLLSSEGEHFLVTSLQLLALGQSSCFAGISLCQSNHAALICAASLSARDATSSDSAGKGMLTLQSLSLHHACMSFHHVYRPRAASCAA